MKKDALIIILLFLLMASIAYIISNRIYPSGEYPLGTSAGNPDNDGPIATYKGDGFHINYPQEMSPTVENDNLRFRHAVGFRHPDFCDMKGDAPFMNEFIDFNVSMHTEEGDLATMGGEGDKEAVTVGVMKGIKVSVGAEGCGMDTYYLDIGDNKILVVERKWIPEYNDINVNKQVFMDLPGIIKPEDGDKIFEGLLNGIQPR